jgi:hypothetical protein
MGNVRDLVGAGLVPARRRRLAPVTIYQLVLKSDVATLKLLPVPDGTGGQGLSLPLQGRHELLHCRK